MATKKAAENLDYSMAEKIAALYDLQKIDSRIDEINKLKGALPIEVADLEAEVAALKGRKEDIDAEITEIEQLTLQRKGEIDQSRALMKKYDEQLKNVRNNREYDSLSKELEYQGLEIELNEKRLREYSATLEQKKIQTEKTSALQAERETDLAGKREELDSIDRETVDQLAELDARRKEASAKIDERLLNAYTRIRGNVRNGLAVVTVRRDACGGCYNRIPPQRQFEIRQNRSAVVCEYCGRILVSDELA